MNVLHHNGPPVSQFMAHSLRSYIKLSYIDRGTSVEIGNALKFLYHKNSEAFQLSHPIEMSQ